MDTTMISLFEIGAGLLITAVILFVLIRGFIHITDWIEGYLVLKNEDVNLRKIQFYSDYDFFKGQRIVDEIIQEGIGEYRLEHFDYEKERDNSHVVNKKEIQDMISYLLSYTVKRLTPGVEALIDQYINQENENDLLTYIGKRINLAVLSYANSVNYQET